MRLRAGLSVLWRCAGESQVGTDPRCAVVLEGLRDGEQRLLDRLEREVSMAELVRLGRAGGVPAARVRALVALLEQAGVLQPHGSTPPPSGSPVPGADVAHWSRARPDGDGAAVLRRRRAATVAVLGLNRLGMSLASALAGAGLGAVLVDDDGLVRRDEVGAGGYLPADVGHPRRERATASLRATYPHVRTSAPPDTRPHVVVVVEQDVADPVRLRTLLREDVVHLVVAVRELDVVVGPLVRPGHGPCTRCVELHRAEADACWPAVATQLLGARDRGVEASLAHAGAAAALGQVLACVDGRPVAVEGASLEIEASAPVPTLRRWPVHPGCGCTGLPVAAGAPGAPPPP